MLDGSKATNSSELKEAVVPVKSLLSMPSSKNQNAIIKYEAENFTF